MSDFTDMTMQEFLERFPAFTNDNSRVGSYLSWSCKEIMSELEGYGFLQAYFIPPDQSVRIYAMDRVQERHAVELLRNKRLR